MIGQTILYYNILEKIGEGGMGVVYKALDTRLDRIVALKFLPSRFTSSKDDEQRFTREAKAAAALNHPNICTIYSVDEHKGQKFISMEYIDGSTLREKFKHVELSLSKVKNYATQIVAALSAAHQQGIIHRDIKPENIMVDGNDRIKVTDFGLARVRGSQHLTREGRIIGTMSYMSPEQIQGMEVDERSDLFSFGIVLYEMLTGIHPFEGEYDQATGFKLLNENPKSPGSIRPGINKGLEDIVTRCLEKNPELRYRTASDLLLELEGEMKWPLYQVSSLSQNGRRLISTFRRKNNKSWFRMAVSGILVLALFVWFSTLLFSGGFFEDRIPEEKHIAVLPFNNLSTNVISANLNDGITEILTSKITQMEVHEGSMWVVPSSEIRSEKVTSVTEASRRFGVNLAVTGSLQGDGNRFRLTINLVDSRSLRQLRASVLELEWTDFANLQDEVVRALTDMLEIEMGPGAVENIMTVISKDSRAYQLYIEGQGSLSRFEDPEKINSAIRLFEQALDIDPDFVLAYVGLAEAYWRKYDLTRETQWTQLARDNAEKAVELNDQLAEVYVTLALLNNGMGRFEESLEHLDRLEKKDRITYEALIEQARAYEGLGQVDNAEETYLKAIDQKKNYWEGYHRLGVFYFKNSLLEEAAEMFQKVIKLTPDNDRAYSNLGGVYISQEKYKEAISILEQSIRIRQNYRALVNLGTHYYYQQNYSNAIRYLEQALDLNETDYRIWGLLGYAYHWAGEDSEKVRESMEKAINLATQQREIRPNDPDLISQLAGYHVTIGNIEYAETLLHQLTSMDVHSPENLSLIAHLYERLGDRHSALYWMEEALRQGYSLQSLKKMEAMESFLKDPRMIELREKYETDDG